MLTRHGSLLATVIAAACLALAGCVAGPEADVRRSTLARERAPVTILVSIDGLQPAQLERGVTPNLTRLAAGGVQGTMRPAFPSKTFPNHQSMVTGLRPDRHGIVGNRMEDARRPGEVFVLATDDPFWWNEAAPVWVEAERQGVRTATMFWPGSNVAFGGTRTRDWPFVTSGGVRPSDWQQFNGDVSDRQRVDAVLDWMRRPPASRPRFVTLYFEDVDDAGHVHGPDAPETNAALAEVDERIGALIAGLEALGQPANLVIVSDHGMAAVDSERVIAIDKVAAPADFRMIENGPYASLVPTPGRESALEAALLRPHEHMRCWRKADIPARFRYGAHPRVPPYLCLAEVGWQILDSRADNRAYRGQHGFDHEAPEMAAIFIAHGPAIRRGVRLPAFDNVEVYPLLARLAGIAPKASDADGDLIDGVLRRKEDAAR